MKKRCIFGSEVLENEKTSFNASIHINRFTLCL